MDQKNLWIAIILSLAIIGIWQFFFVLPHQQEIMRQAEVQQKAEQLAQPKTVETPEVDKPREDALRDTRRIKIESGQLHGSIALKGARFDDLTLVRYRQTVDPDSPEVVLLSPSGTKEVYFAELGWLAGNTKLNLPGPESEWKTDQTALNAGESVTLTYDNGQNLIFRRTIALDQDFMFTVTDTVENKGKEPVTLSPYGLISRTHDQNGQQYYILHEGALGVLDGTLKEITYGDLKDSKGITELGKKGWLGITDKYWLTSLIPSGMAFDARFSHHKVGKQERYQVDFRGAPVTIEPGQPLTVTTRLFAGAKKLELLDDYAEKYNIPLFDRAVDFGWFYFLTKPMFKVLNYFFLHLGNFGLALLLLTVCVKLVMYPLAHKSYESMSQMKEFQPEVMKIKERTGEDKAKFNKELMEFYKRQKINPMAGCLPLLIQIPVFFSLYKVLFVTIEMRHAPFYGWIKDLSAPDPTSLFNLFGLLPFDPPTVLMLGAWPCIMGVTMWLLQRMNPTPTDPTQAMVMKFLPVMFPWLFANLPAGLIIYWSWNNVLSIGQQWLIARKMKKRKTSN